MKSIFIIRKIGTLLHSCSVVAGFINILYWCNGSTLPVKEEGRFDILHRGRLDTAGVLSLAYGLAYAKHLSSDGKMREKSSP